MSGGVDLKEFLSAYLAEAEEQLGVASARAVAIEEKLRTGAANPRAVRDMYRALHTLKGLSSMVGVEPVVEIAHRMESVLRASDRAGGAMNAEALDVLLRGVRAIEQRVRAVGQGARVPPATAELLDALDALEPGVAPVAKPAALVLDVPAPLAAKLAPFEIDQLLTGAREGRRALRADFVPSPARAAEGLTINTVRERLGRVAEIVKVLPVAVPRSEEAPGGLSFALLFLSAAADAELAAAVGVGVETLRSVVRGEVAPLPSIYPAAEELDEGAEPHRRNVLRVEVDRLDDAMDRLAALIVTRSRLARAVSDLTARGAETRELGYILQENTRQLRDLRAAILHVRTVPIGDVLERVPLIVRALRRETRKLVRLELDAGNAELDKSVAERLFPAVVHLVRNAVDHGLEEPDERRRRGKPEEGSLRISCAARENGQLELTVTDDGRGVDAEQIARRLSVDAPTTPLELLDLLCRPGFSTRGEATTTSGRGLGMDIVRRVTESELGGELRLATTPGQGTTFTLRVPLSIAIVEAFIVGCAGHRFVVPVSMVEEIIEVDRSKVREVPWGNARLIERRGEALLLVQLGALFALGTPTTARLALVVRHGGQAAAIGLDTVLGQQEAVVRPLLDPLVQVPGVSGSTDLGDGRPTLVLDLGALAARLGRRTEHAA